tara:strand:+ start:937 stop:1335 length:399 start_codon:yes stop_codon:yes gene_type:complete
MSIRLPVVVVGLAWLLTVPTSAHHSFAAEFDANLPISLSGVVTKIEWSNPHVWFFIDVTDESGAIANWGWEMGSPNGLMRQGWTRNSMAIGDVVSVEGSGAKDGGNRANARVVLLSATGERLFAASSQGQAP